MSVSLDGYIAGPAGRLPLDAHQGGLPLRHDEVREVGVHLLGRRLYETMLYWESADQDPSLDDDMVAALVGRPAMLEFAAIRRCLARGTR